MPENEPYSTIAVHNIHIEQSGVVLNTLDHIVWSELHNQVLDTCLSQIRKLVYTSLHVGMRLRSLYLQNFVCTFEDIPVSIF